MRAKRQKARPTHSAAANRDHSGSASSAEASLQAKSHKVEAIANSHSPTSSAATMQQLKQREQGSAVQARMQLQSESVAQQKSASSLPTVEGFNRLVQATGAMAGQTNEGHGAENTPIGSDTTPVQLALMTVDGFKSKFKNDKERKSDAYEYHAQICDDLKLYHDNEYDPSKQVADEINMKFDIRKMALERVILGCNLWLHFPIGKPPTTGSQVPWNTVSLLKQDAEFELNSYYKNAEGRESLWALLGGKKQQYQSEVYSADEFKSDANLGVVTGNVGDMAAVVGKLKAFHAIKENPGDDSTRVAKLTILEALLQTAKTTADAIRKEQGSKANPGFWKDQKSHLNALDNLIAMLQNNKHRYTDPLAWRLNLQNLASRNKDAAAGTGVSADVSTSDSDWVDVDDGYGAAKEMAAQTEEILEKLSSGNSK